MSALSGCLRVQLLVGHPQTGSRDKWVSYIPVQTSLGPLMGGSQSYVSILRNNNVALPNLRNGHVTLSILRNCHVPCHYLVKIHVACHQSQKGPCRRVDFSGLGPYHWFPHDQGRNYTLNNTPFNPPPLVWKLSHKTTMTIFGTPGMARILDIWFIFLKYENN